METDNYREKQTTSRKESMEAFRALVLLILIATFIGTQFYFLLASIMAP